MHFSGSGAYLDIGPFPAECIIDSSKCIYGITVSFVVQFEDTAQNWTGDTLVVDTIGGNTTRKGKPGFAVYVTNNRLYVTVVALKRNWTISKLLITGDMVWNHVMFSWHMEKGLVLYLNGTQRSVACHRKNLSYFLSYKTLKVLVFRVFHSNFLCCCLKRNSTAIKECILYILYYYSYYMKQFIYHFTTHTESFVCNN